MGLRKQEFYEGAALHLLARAGAITSVNYQAPFFIFNARLRALLKYSTKGRSPWGFTFTTEEQAHLQRTTTDVKTVIALICGSDGVAAFDYDAYLSVATPRDCPIHIACYRQHGEHYEVNGPDGRLSAKVAPSKWQNILVC